MLVVMVEFLVHDMVCVTVLDKVLAVMDDVVLVINGEKRCS